MPSPDLPEAKRLPDFPAHGEPTIIECPSCGRGHFSWGAMSQSWNCLWADCAFHHKPAVASVDDLRRALEAALADLALEREAGSSAALKLARVQAAAAKYDHPVCTEVRAIIERNDV